jgi:hypothetical protein
MLSLVMRWITIFRNPSWIETKTRRLEGKVYLLCTGGGCAGTMAGETYYVVFLTQSGQKIRWQSDLAEHIMYRIGTAQGSCYRIKAHVRENGNVQQMHSITAIKQVVMDREKLHH